MTVRSSSPKWVVGFVSVSHRRHFTGAVDASVDDLAVAEDWEGRGIARTLLNDAEAWAREQSLARITVETIAGNDRAKRRYRSFGYRDEELRFHQGARNRPKVTQPRSPARRPDQTARRPTPPLAASARIEPCGGGEHGRCS